MKNRVVNNVILYGYVYQLGSSDKNKLSVKTVKNATSPNFGKEFIAGEIHIAVDEDGLNVIPVRFSYVTAYRKDGKTKNPSYKVLESIIANEAEHCWITAGKENAYKVKLTCSLDVNDFYSQRDEKVVSALQISGSFADFVNVLPEEKDRNRFEADILFNRVKRIEADEERGITEEYAELSGAVFNFRNELLPERFVMKKPDGIEYFESLDISPSEPQFAHCTGAVNCMTIKRERVSESLWGEAQVNTIETKDSGYSDLV